MADEIPAEWLRWLANTDFEDDAFGVHINYSAEEAPEKSGQDDWAFYRSMLAMSPDSQESFFNRVRRWWHEKRHAK